MKLMRLFIELVLVFGPLQTVSASKSHNANSVDPNQLALIGAIWSGSSLFAILILNLFRNNEFKLWNFKVITYRLIKQMKKLGV